MTTTLVVYADTALCDGSCRDALTLYTDGVIGYAVRPDNTLETTTILRDGVMVTADCPDEDCHGRYEWPLDVEGTWTSERRSIDMLEHAEPMDVA